MLEMHNLPFKFQGEAGQGKGGLLILNEDSVTLEFEVTRLLFFSDIERVTIPITQLQQVAVQKDGLLFYNWTLTLTARSLQTFRSIPGSRREVLSLQLDRDKGEPAKRFVTALMIKITEFEISAL